jgi:predicted transcriptional regulator
MAIIWNISLREKLDRQPKLREIEKESGITERTIRKAKKKYPQLFIK